MREWKRARLEGERVKKDNHNKSEHCKPLAIVLLFCMAMFQSSGDGGSTLTTVSRISVPFCPNRMKSRLSISTCCVHSPAVGCNIPRSGNVNIKKIFSHKFKLKLSRKKYVGLIS